MSAPQSYTQDDVSALLSKMALERGKLITAAEGLRGDDADQVPVDAVGEEQWTAKEQLAHLMEMERSYVAWCRAGVAESGVDVSNVRGDAVRIPIEDAPDHTVRELLDELIGERERTNAYIRSLSVSEFSHTAVTPGFGELTVMQYLRSFYRHDRQHTAQIEGRQSDYQPNFAAGAEPNQRQMRIESVAQRRSEGS